jgi:anti-sigma factor RsiW
MSFSEEILMAYADEELDPQLRAQVETAIAGDPALARKVSQHQALRARLSHTFDRVLDEPVPERLLATARTAPTLQPRTDNVVPLRRRPPRRQSTWAQLAALGATLVLGIGLGELLPRPVTTEPITRARDGGLLAGSSLARALSRELSGGVPSAMQATSPVQPGSPLQAGGPGARESVQIVASFRSRAGDYCRAFMLQSVLAGLACRGEDGWRVRVLAETALEEDPGGALPARIAQAVPHQLVSEPLDAQAEAAARARNWRP